MTEEEVKILSEHCSEAELNPFPELVSDAVFDGLNDGLPSIYDGEIDLYVAKGKQLYIRCVKGFSMTMVSGRKDTMWRGS